MAKARVELEDKDEDLVEQAKDLAQLNEDEGGEVFRAIEELRGVQGTTVVIVKLTPSDEAGFLENMPVAEFNHEELKKRYGAGLYKIRMRGPKGWIPGGGNIRISTAGISKPAASPGGELAQLLDIMERRDAERKKESSERLSRLTELGIPALTTIVAALISRNTSPDITGILTALKPAPAPSLADITATMANIQATLGANKGADPLDNILRIMEVVKGLTGEGGSKEGESNWLDVVRDVVKEAVPAVKPMLENLAAKQAAEQAVRQAQGPLQIQPLPIVPRAVSSVSANPASTSPSVPPAESNSVGTAEGGPERAIPEGDDMMSLFLPMIRQQLTKITQWAIADYNPQTYAEVFINELPQMVANYIRPEQALEYLNRADWFEKVTDFHAMLKPYHEWCDEFRQELILLVTEQMEEEFAGEVSSKPKKPVPQITDPVNGDTSGE